MENPHEDLRRLAGWLARRRAVDEVIAQLTHYGLPATLADGGDTVISLTAERSRRQNA
ncbi:MAG: hypothetical protein ACR2K2_01755 [Mycobacteriales bacterium]